MKKIVLSILVFLNSSQLLAQNQAPTEILTEARGSLPVVEIKEPDKVNLQIANSVDQNQFNDELESFIQLLEENLAFREKTIELIKANPTVDLRNSSYQNWVLTILKGAHTYLKNRNAFLNIISKYSVYKNTWDNEKASVLTKKKMMLALASAFVVYDNYFSMVNLVSKYDKIRVLLNQGDATNNIPVGVVDSIASEAKSWGNRSLLAAQTTKYVNFIKKFPTNLIDDQLYYLSGVIRSSPSFPIFNGGQLSRIFTFAAARISDNVNELTDTIDDTARETSNTLSLLFGNTVGLVSTRSGKLNPINKPGLAKKLIPEMKPLDILLEKTPFRLTDRFIPGHWGHVAIWIGSKQQLQEEGLWDLITDEKNQEAWRDMPADKRKRIIKKLESGKAILEALRPVVELNSLTHFLNIDDLLVVRPTYVQNDKARKAELIAQALTHFEKEYDFNFDVTTADRIVCSELAYWVFPDINWLTENMLGRESISPDNVINTVLNRPNDFSSVLLYHDGKYVKNSGQAYRKELCSLQKYSDLRAVNKECR